MQLQDKRLREVAHRLQRDTLDVEVAFPRRRRHPTQRPASHRLVGVRLPESTGYRFYLTNIAPASLDVHTE